MTLALLSCQQASTPDHSAPMTCESSTAIDGEGCAWLSTDKLITGTKARFKITFITGESGIPVGGGIALGLHHGSEWGIQVRSPKKGNWLNVETELNNLQMENAYPRRFKMFPGERSSKFSNRIFNNVFRARVIDQALPPHTKVTFTFGANRHQQHVQRYQDKEHEIRVTTDIDADGTYDRIAQTLMLKVLHGDATQLSANTPSQVKTGDLFPVLIRAEDRYYNVDDNFSGTVNITDEHGHIIGENIPLKNGLARTQVKLKTHGPHRLRLTQSNGTIKGRSNPIRSYETLPDTRLYWGDIHGHTGISDGLGRDTDEYFRFGRDVAGLDIIALTDHGQPDWDGTMAAVQKFHTPGEYVTLLAQEAGSGPDHMNIYFRRDDADHISRWQNDYKRFQDWIYNQYNTQTPAGAVGEAITGPHHFAYTRGGSSDPRYPFGHWDNRVARFVEVYSSHGTSEFKNNPRPLRGNPQDDSKFMQSGLAKGLRFAVIGASDNHDSHPGRSGWGLYPNGLAGFWIPELSREAVWEALWNYRVYATSFDRIYTEFSLNGHIVGSDISTDGPLDLKAYIIGKTDNLSVTLIRDNQEIMTKNTTTGVIEFDMTDTPPSGDHFYYLRVTQDNDERAWTTPIWVKQK